jgi:hypothetical protein
VAFAQSVCAEELEAAVAEAEAAAAGEIGELRAEAEAGREAALAELRGAHAAERARMAQRLAASEEECTQLSSEAAGMLASHVVQVAAMKVAHEHALARATAAAAGEVGELRAVVAAAGPRGLGGGGGARAAAGQQLWASGESLPLTPPITPTAVNHLPAGRALGAEEAPIKRVPPAAAEQGAEQQRFHNHRYGGSACAPEEAGRRGGDAPQPEGAEEGQPPSRPARPSSSWSSSSSSAAAERVRAERLAGAESLGAAALAGWGAAMSRGGALVAQAQRVRELAAEVSSLLLPPTVG